MRIGTPMEDALRRCWISRWTVDFRYGDLYHIVETLQSMLSSTISTNRPWKTSPGRDWAIWALVKWELTRKIFYLSDTVSLVYFLVIISLVYFNYDHTRLDSDSDFCAYNISRRSAQSNVVPAYQCASYCLWLTFLTVGRYCGRFVLAAASISAWTKNWKKRPKRKMFGRPCLTKSAENAFIRSARASSLSEGKPIATTRSPTPFEQWIG